MMIDAVKNIGKSGYHYTRGFVFNLVVFAIIYKLFGFEWLIVFGLADITRDLGIIMMRTFDNRNPDSRGNAKE